MLSIFLILAMNTSAFFLGVLVHKRRSIDYKKRWQSAVRLLEAEQTKTLAISPGTDAPDARPLISRSSTWEPYGQNRNKAVSRSQMEAVLKMTSVQRYETEGARLDAKMKPIDPLTNMSGHWTKEMLLRRAKYGYE